MLIRLLAKSRNAGHGSLLEAAFADVWAVEDNGPPGGMVWRGKVVALWRVPVASAANTSSPSQPFGLWLTACFRRNRTQSLNLQPGGTALLRSSDFGIRDTAIQAGAGACFRRQARSANLRASLAPRNRQSELMSQSSLGQWTDEWQISYSARSAALASISVGWKENGTLTLRPSSRSKASRSSLRWMARHVGRRDVILFHSKTPVVGLRVLRVSARFHGVHFRGSLCSSSVARSQPKFGLASSFMHMHVRRLVRFGTVEPDAIALLAQNGRHRDSLQSLVKGWQGIVHAVTRCVRVDGANICFGGVPAFVIPATAHASLCWLNAR